jgi:hypothetical protein
MLQPNPVSQFRKPGKMSGTTRIIFIAIIAFASSGLSCSEPPQANDIHRLWMDCKLEEVVPFNVFNVAVIGYRQIPGIKKGNILTIIDYSKPSVENRFCVIDLENKKLLYNCLVAHGKNSGENIAKSFSNEPNSLQSSLGFFLTAETYVGENGYSMKLDGLEKGINDNARSREIVIHGANYVSLESIAKYGRIGRSWGCPALPLEISREVIDVIANGSCLFIYGDDNSYYLNSAF